MSKSLALSSSWDLTVSAGGDIALATDDAALAQDVASAIRLFAGELYYDTTQGIPYFEQILGKAYTPNLIASLISEAALTVPGVAKATVSLDSVTSLRQLSGTVFVTTDSGRTLPPIGF